MFLLFALLILVSGAVERASVRLHAGEGLDVDRVHEIAFDRDGFLWVATPLGLRRFDGKRFVPFPSPPGVDAPWQLLPLSDGGLMVRTMHAHRVFLVHDGVWDEIAPPDADGFQGPTYVDDANRLWHQEGGEVLLRDGGPWRPYRLPLVEGERLLLLRSRGGGIDALTTRGALEIRDGVAARTLLLPDPQPVVDAVLEPEGTWLLLTRPGTLTRWTQPDDGTPAVRNHVLGEHLGRGIQLLRRGASTWVIWDHLLGRVAGRDLTDVQRINTGSLARLGPDGAMYLPTAAGILVLPEPETITYDEDDGLQKPTVRAVTADGRSVWVATWGGSVRIDANGVYQTPPDSWARDRWCLDGHGVAHSPIKHGEQGPVAQRTHLLEAWIDDELRTVTQLDPDFYASCTTDDGGVIWVVNGPHLWRVPPGGPAESVAEHGMPVWSPQIVHDGAGTLWLVDKQLTCHANPDQAASGQWACLDAGPLGAAGINAAVHHDDGWTWLASSGAGLLRARPGTIEVHPKFVETFGHRDVTGMAPSPRGGVWLVGNGLVVRVDRSLRVLERLDRWNGMALTSASDVVELPDGDLWLGSATGVVHLPASARQQPEEPPPLRVIAVDVDGEPADFSRNVDVPPPPSRVVLDVAALSFRDRERVRYRMRDGSKERPLEGGRIELLDLPAGSRTVSIEASLDGVRWSTPVSVTLDIAPPWWRTWWFTGLVLAIILGLLWAAYRLRVAWLVGRERERTHLAMDLHDELGSGLGSIRLLASVLERPDLDGEARATLASRITRSAGDLHESVQQLSGSLRAGGTRTDVILDRLSTKARDLFADPDVELVIVAPDVNRNLELDEARELERLASEALHNAARHALATRVTLGMAFDTGRLRLWVSDDGVGFDPGHTREGGLGTTSMRARADRIGATLTIDSTPGEGTTITAWTRPRKAWLGLGPTRTS